MKIIFLAPGLGRIKRGFERFVLELAGSLRESGLDAVCWGTSEAPDVEILPAPSRLEFHKLALDQIRGDAHFAGLPASALQDWSLYTEDQLFAIPAAYRVRELLDAGERLLVYTKWQGGLIDPSGAPTDLLRTLAVASREGNAQLVVHTDYICTAIDTMLWNAGAVFHSLGSWITMPLRQMGVPPSGIIELPMCVEGSLYRDARRHRDEVRRELNIPQSAFVVLSVGSFDTTTPDKRHAHLLQEILSFPDADRIWWVVAGSRGTTPMAWEEEARRKLGSHFIPLTNLPFNQMPRLYGAADLFALASLDETFGLVYIEAQIAGLPTPIHETKGSSELCRQNDAGHAAISLVDMKRKGVAAAAISRWLGLLNDPREQEALRKSLDAFARAQEERFSWAYAGRRFAEAFRNAMPSATAAKITARDTFGTWDEQFHRQALRCFEQKQYADAALLLSRALGGRETAERWNDWGAVQLALSKPAEAEQGFRRALSLDAGDGQAAANLGALLASSDRAVEAIPFLERSLEAIEESQRQAVRQLLESSRAASAQQAGPPGEELTRFFHQSVTKNNSDGWPGFLDRVPYLVALFENVPAGAGKRALVIDRADSGLTVALSRFRSYASVQQCQPGALLQAGGSSANETTSPAENAAWPFADGNFDAVILSDVLQAFADPMQALAEANRVLSTSGVLVVSAPNLTSTKSLQSLLRGESPYVSGKIGRIDDGEPAHHREYSPSEIGVLAEAAGFGHAQVHTEDVFWEPPANLFQTLTALGFSVGSRGDTIFLRAQKESGVRDRFPDKLYERHKPARTPATAADAGVNASNGDVSRVRILVVYETLPLADRGGADHRLLQIIRLLREQGHSVTFLAPRGYGKETYAPVLRNLGVEIRIEDAHVLAMEGMETTAQWTLQEVLREGQFDLAILSLWFWMGVTLPEYYLDEIRRLSPATRVAILTDDCHGLREAGRAKLSGLWSDKERARDFAEREMEIHRRADFVISISPADQKRIKREVGDVPVELLPMMIEASASAGSGFVERDGLVYLANFNNPASLDGLEWYLRDVAPLVRRELPDVKLYLVGAGLPSDWKTDDPSVVRVGPVLDLSAELSRRRILVSPVRFGTGIKTKNLHALANGLPVVTNTLGAEGLKFADGESALIADDPKRLAQHIVRLYNDASLWNKLSANSRAHIQNHFSKRAMETSLRAVLQRALGARAREHDQGHVWSVRLVEKLFREVLTFHPAKDRPSIRILAYARAAELLAGENKLEEARRQLRHVSSFVPSRMSSHLFFGSFFTVAESMDRTYRKLGEESVAAELRREASLHTVGAFNDPCKKELGTRTSAKVSLKKPQHGNRSVPDISVIIPTHNRRGILAECLDALDRQWLSPRRFEVIVVDDGSTDDTRAFFGGAADRYRYKLVYLRQENAGAGAARRLGVAQARGRYLLVINDDTICDPDLLRTHLEAHRERSGDKIAVLGDFRYPADARKRALTHFLSSQPFLFPQVTLQAGIHSTNAFFITCNLSVSRDAVLSAGSFDAAFRIAEDTELGIRLTQRGFRVLYVPEARAIHRHLDFTIHDLVKRAEVYGKVCVALYEKHPSLLADGKGPFGSLDQPSISKLRSFLRERSDEVSAAVDSLAKFDQMDFEPFFGKQMNGKNAAGEVMDLFARSVPIVFWFHIFRGFLEVWDNKPIDATDISRCSSPQVEQPANS